MYLEEISLHQRGGVSALNSAFLMDLYKALACGFHFGGSCLKNEKGENLPCT